MEDSLDLRSGGLLSIELSIELTKITHSVRDEYTDYIGRLTQTNSLKGLDWLVNVTCRNPYQTKIFDNFCKLRLLESCLNNNLVNTVIVEDQGMYNVVYELINKYNYSLEIQLQPTKNSSPLLLTIRNILFSLYIATISFIVPRLFVKGRRKMPNKPIVYLDTFAKVIDFSENGDFTDHYFPGLLDNMTHEQAQIVWYAPFIYSLRNFFDLRWVINQSRLSKLNFFIMEEWLKFSDYLYAFYRSFYLTRRVKRIPRYNGLNVSELIRQELSKELFSPGLMRTILIYRFIYRLKNAGVEIAKVIDWNENQVTDRALNLAIRSFYPSTPIIGYQGYIVSEHYVSHSPACYEVDASTIPDRICVISQKHIQRKREFCQKQDVSISPAFRFQKLFKHTRNKNVKREIVLLVLPYNLDISKTIINVCFDWNQSNGIEFVVKVHPAVSKSVLTKNIRKISNDCFKFTEDPLHELLERSMLIISSDSSACFEAVAFGVHVIIIGNRNGSTSNPLDGIADSVYWDICYEADCMQKVLEANRDDFDFDVNSVLMPVNSMSVKDFLDF